MVDDATNEVTEDAIIVSKDAPKSNGDAAKGLP